MKKNLIIITTSLFILTTAGILSWQYNINKKHNLLLSVDKLMTEHADSALHILQKFNNPQHLYGENAALYALLMTQAQYKNYIPVENDSLIHIAVDYYSTRKDSLRKAWSYFYMAQVCRDTKDSKRALTYFQKAAIASNGCQNNKLLALLYYHWGRLLQTEFPYEEGINKLMKAKEYETQNKDTVSLINVLGEIGWSYMYKEDFKQAQAYVWEGIKLAQHLKSDEQISWLYQHLSMSYLQNNQFTTALEKINESIKYSHNDSVYLLYVWATKGLIFNDLQQYDSAYYYIEKGKRTDNLYNIASYQNEMSRIEEGLGNYKKALMWSRLYSSYKDSIEIYERDRNLMELQKKYDYSLIQNENIQSKAKLQRRGIAILAITIVLLITLFVTYYIYNKSERKKENIIRLKDTLLEQTVRQLQQKTNELLQNKQAVQDKENKLREYILKERGLKEDISLKEKELQSYIQQQKKLKEQIFKMNKTVQRIEAMNSLNLYQKKQAKAQLILSEQELANLFSAINFCYNNFEERLRTEYPHLTNDDIYICCLLKMGVNNQNIIILLEMNEEALKKRKYRIKRERMNLSQDGISLEEYLKDY